MKLAKGTLKVIVGDVEKAEENQARAKVGGKIFVPPWTIYEWDTDEDLLTIHKVHSFSAATLHPKTTLTSSFPYKWAPFALRYTALWLETTGEVTIHNSLEEDSHG